MRRTTGGVQLVLCLLAAPGAAGAFDFSNTTPQGHVNTSGSGQVQGSLTTQSCSIQTQSQSEGFTLRRVFCPLFMPPGFGCDGGCGGTASLSTTTDVLGQGAFSVKANDPILLQFPANVSNFSGTFDSTNLAIQSGLNCVDMAPGKQLCAEVGHQIVIIDFPGLSQGSVAVTLNFLVDCGSNPCVDIIVKPLLTVQVIQGSRTFYVPLGLCIDSLSTFADVPAMMTIPAAATSQNLTPVLNPNPTNVCAVNFLRLEGAAGVQVASPAMTPWTLGLLALLLVGVEIARLRRKSRFTLR